MTKHFNDIEYELIDPTGNITALVRTAVDEADQPRIAGLILDAEESCEQVGFTGSSSGCDIALRMAAGEFCGNAVMSTAALYCDDNGIDKGQERTVHVCSSGCDKPLVVDITRKEDKGQTHVYNGRVTMPDPRDISCHVFTYKDRFYDLPVVRFDGILHVIAKSGDISFPDEEMQGLIRDWCDQAGAECFGIMMTDIEDDLFFRSEAVNDKIMISMRPLVYVPMLSSCYWENSCASGTTAVASYLSHELGDEDITVGVKQRGGTLTVHIKDRQKILEGNVSI